MNIEGLDYNTQRKQMVMPEYGREIQKMVDYAVSLEGKAERQQCAEAIVCIMERMFPQNKENNDYKQKLWDHLAIMSNFKLDIDYPYDVSVAAKIADKPQPVPYPNNRIPVRHYGHMMMEMFGKLKDMPEGPERDEMARQVANQMKRNLTQWSHGSSDNDKIVSDMERLTDGKVTIDLYSFKFDNSGSKQPSSTDKRKKRR